MGSRYAWHVPEARPVACGVLTGALITLERAKPKHCRVDRAVAAPHQAAGASPAPIHEAHGARRPSERRS